VAIYRCGATLVQADELDLRAMEFKVGFVLVVCKSNEVKQRTGLLVARLLVTEDMKLPARLRHLGFITGYDLKLAISSTFRAMSTTLGGGLHCEGATT
jgi:hypothetical protein